MFCLNGLIVRSIIRVGTQLRADARVFKVTAPQPAYEGCRVWLGFISAAKLIIDSVQSLIKELITALMLSTPPRVRAQLSEALTIISGHDFPAKWQVIEIPCMHACSLPPRQSDNPNLTSTASVSTTPTTQVFTCYPPPKCGRSGRQILLSVPEVCPRDE